MNTILVIDDEENMRHMLTAFLSKHGYSVECANDGKQGLAMLSESGFDLVLCDLKMPVMDGLAFLQGVRQSRLSGVVIMMSAYATVDTAVEAMRLGAFDVVSKPFKTDEILIVLKKAEELVQLKDENVSLRKKVEELNESRGFQHLVGQSKQIQDIVQLARRVAGYDTSVLITGESGTGKELLAKGIHAHSQRRDKEFVAVNCGSIPLSLMESEFFGHVKGSFTGADRNKQGLFAAADKSTLFLDEIGELPLEIQVKLLRVLQEREIRPVGSTITHKVDVRVIAATAKNLAKESAEGRFRHDLLFRLNVVELDLPPLRQRVGDISLLVNHFLGQVGAKLGMDIQHLEKDALKMLNRYSWPGNVRELENAIEHAMIYAEKGIICPKSLPFTVRNAEPYKKKDKMFDVYSIKEGKALLEKHLITKALQRCSGNKSQAAELLEISYPSLLSKIKEYNVAIK